MRVLLAVAVVLAGCTPGSDETAPTPSPSPAVVAATTSAPQSTATQRTAPPFTANTEEDTQEGSGDDLTVTGVRLRPEDGFDRVVFDLDGTGTPGWRVAYVPEPLPPGDETPISMGGVAFLEVSLTDVGSPFDPDHLQHPDAGVVADVALGGVVGGDYVTYIGLRERVPFRVYELDGPPRVVIEAVHPR